MQTPYITIDLKKIEHNTRVISELCESCGISVLGVTKGTLGMPEVARAMIRGGASWIGDSRLNNLKRLRDNDIDVPLLLMRSPHLSEIERVVDLADISLNSELEVIKALSEEGLKQNKIHKIIIMADLGDLREGLMPEELQPVVEETLKLKGVKLIGLGTNLTDLNGVIPTYENNMELVRLAEEIESEYNIRFEYLSAGNSSSLKLIKKGEQPSRINHFRLGESILLGRETLDGDDWEGTYQDAFIITAEIIECKVKPSLPKGDIGVDAFGMKPIFSDMGLMKRSIINLGRQDSVADGLIPVTPGIVIIGSTSDHMVIDTTGNSDLKVGSYISFSPKYGAMLAAMTSPFVYKNLIK